MDKNNVYVTTGNGFFESTDGGTNFSFLPTDIYMKSFVFISPQEAWGGGKVVSSGIYHSTDGGKNWINLVETNNEFGIDRYLAVDFVSENVGWILGKKS